MHLWEQIIRRTVVWVDKSLRCNLEYVRVIVRLPIKLIDGLKTKVEDISAQGFRELCNDVSHTVLSRISDNTGHELEWRRLGHSLFRRTVKIKIGRRDERSKRKASVNHVHDRSAQTWGGHSLVRWDPWGNLEVRAHYLCTSATQEQKMGWEGVCVGPS